jgi:medium-chain acyl-[acyl-carrier-protein] hydrolase
MKFPETMERKIDRRWFPSVELSSGKSRMFCFPYAGGNATLFRNWKNYFREDVEIWAVEFPGRSCRLSEPAYTSVRPLVDELANVVSEWLDKPFVFWGHSMGALIAFELSCKLADQIGKQPEHLFVSARSAPQFPSTEPTYTLPYDKFVQELHRLEGTPPEVLENEELLTILVPLLRADFQLVQTYQYQHTYTLTCPITAMGGVNDKDVSREQLEGWKSVSSGPFKLQMFAGNHFYLHHSERLILDFVARQLGL